MTQVENSSIKKLSCRTVLLSDFIDAIVDGNRDIIPEEEYQKILNEFYELSDKATFDGVVIMDRDIKYLKNKLFAIQFAVDMLRKVRNQKFIDVLVNYGFEFDWEDRKNFLKNLDRVINRSQSEVVELRQLEEVYSQQHRPNNSEQPTPEQLYDYFSTWLMLLSDDAGYTIQPEKIKIIEFCRRCTNLQAKQQKWQMKRAAKTK